MAKIFISLTNRQIHFSGIRKLSYRYIEGAKKLDKPLIFVACGQKTEAEKKFGKQLQETLIKQYNVDCFFAESANDLESLNLHIFKKLSDCAGFIAILHKRENDRHETSVWINQEIAIIAFLRFQGKACPTLVLYQEGIEPQGLIKSTIANPVIFKSDKEAFFKIEDWMQGGNFKNNIVLDIDLKESYKKLGYGCGGGRAGVYGISYLLLCRIRNYNNQNIPLENVNIENGLLGKAQLDRHNKKLTKLPFNIEAHRTEEINLNFLFPNVLNTEQLKKQFNLFIEFHFRERVISKEQVVEF